MSKYLQFQCGPYRLLLGIEYIADIAEHTSGATRHGDSTPWHGHNILFMDMRHLLEPGLHTHTVARHTLALQEPGNEIPQAILGIDDVFHIIEIADSQWHKLNGITPGLDVFFDRVYVDTHSKSILLGLAPVQQWANKNTINKNNGNPDAY